MATPSMKIAHDTSTPVAVAVAAVVARRAAAARRRRQLRWLAVEEGRVWLTRSQQALEPGEDIWLSAGQHLPLPAGSEWVAEGWPEASVVVLEAPQA
jgi:hypothetical protein